MCKQSFAYRKQPERSLVAQGKHVYLMESSKHLACTASTKLSIPRTTCLTMQPLLQVPKFIASQWREDCQKAAASESTDPIHLGKVRISKSTGQSSVRLACQAPCKVACSTPDSALLGQPSLASDMP